MSDLPNSVTYLTQAMRNGVLDKDSFHKFFECWLVEQNNNLEELISAAREQEEHKEDERILRPLLDRVIKHYEHYYRAKSRWAKNDVLSMFSPSWRSSLEDAFLWIGGWRPTMAFHLLYSKSGLQLEARLDGFMQGIGTGDLGDLSADQLVKIDELQRETIREERELTEEMAKQQEMVADSSMVELAHSVTEMIRHGDVDEATDEGRVKAALAPKEEGMVETLQKADDLRLKTLKKVLNTMKPIQAAHFLIAAAALHLRVHDWGKKRDATHHHHIEHHQPINVDS